MLTHEVQSGALLVDAAMRQARALVSTEDVPGALAFAEGLKLDPATHDLGVAAAGVVAFDRSWMRQAWACLDSLPFESWSRYAVREWVRCGLIEDRAATLDKLRQLAGRDHDVMRANDWLGLVGPAFGAGEQDLARSLFQRLEESIEADPELPSYVIRNRDWLVPWIAADIDTTTPAGEHPTFGVIDYGHPGINRGSANLGDHVQSIASLGHLVRHQDVRLHGPDDLVGLLGRLGERTRPELRVAGTGPDLDVMTVHRDGSMYQEIPEGTWTLCFGWYMHPLFYVRHGFPMHAALRPIFVSFHCNKRELLTDEAIAYLKRYGPVGCRDWTTAYLLLSLDVPAFFSGCITTTINTVFPDLAETPGNDAPVAYVDVPEEARPPDAPHFEQSDRSVRGRSFVENMDSALAMLESYRAGHSAVVTSRLHCYLPMRSVGMPVDFRPKNPSDIRFDGLAGITDDAFDAIGAGIRDSLQQVFASILSGASEDDVYRLWRELTSADVAAAEVRLHAEAPSPATSGLLRAEVAAAAEAAEVLPTGTTPDPAEEVHCAVFVDRRQVRHLAPLVRSLVAGSTRPVRLWVFGRPKGDKARAALSAEFPDVRLTWVRTAEIDAALDTPDGEPVRDVARLLLPELMPGVERVVVLPVPSVVDGDISDLAGLDLGGQVFAPAPSPVTGRGGFGLLHRAAGRLQERTARAAELRRTAHARHTFDFDAFSDAVLVLDLDAARREVDRDVALSLVTTYGLYPVEVLHYLFGPHHADLPEGWYHAPGQDPGESGRITHWTGDNAPPWGRRCTPGRDLWDAWTRPRDAAGTVPVSGRPDELADRPDRAPEREGARP